MLINFSGTKMQMSLCDKKEDNLAQSPRGALLLGTSSMAGHSTLRSQTLTSSSHTS